jgi:hypothetical protein
MSDDHDEDEAREAEALARALDRGTASDDLPERELQTAALIRYSADGGALSEEREDALLADVIAAADKIAQKKGETKPVPAPWWRWIAAFAGVSAVAIVIVIVVAGPLRTVEPTALPAPNASLLSAQMGRLEDTGDDARFETEMTAYRRDVYDALGERYGSR